jgi:ATP-binding cassette subfamily B protein
MADAFRPKGRAIGVILACNLIAAAAGVGVPILMARGVDMMVQTGTPAGMAALASGLFILGAAGWGVNWIRRRVTARAVGDVMLALRRRAFAAAAEHDLSFYDEHSSGRIVSRITSDTEEFANVVTLVADLMSSFVQAGILLIVLARIEVRLLPWLLVTLPPVFFCAYAFRRLARTATRRGFRAMANVNALTKEAVSGIAVAKNFRQEGAIFTEFDRVNRQSYAINVRRGFVLGMIFPVLNALAGPGTALLLYAGAVNVAGALITYGSWYLFVTSLDYFWDPMLAFSSYWSRIQGGLSAAERVFALIDAESAVVQMSGPVPVLRGEIRSSTWGSTTSREPVLSDRPARASRGDAGARRAHRRRQVEHRQAGDALLRVPERAAADRRDGHPHARPARLPPAVGHRAAVAVPVLGDGDRQHPLCAPGGAAGRDRGAGAADRRGRVARVAARGAGDRGWRARGGCDGASGSWCR